MKALYILGAIIVICFTVTIVITCAWLSWLMIDEMGLIDKIRDLFDSFDGFKKG